MTYDELMKALECHAEKNWCEKCPIQDSETCSMDIAREALKVLDKRQMALKTVMMALEKGGYSVTVNPTGEVWIRPWDSMPWISMRDEQPDHDGVYLTFHGLTVMKDWFKGESPDMLIGVCSWYKDKGGWYSLLADESIKNVTHWMPLPTVPEGWG